MVKNHQPGRDAGSIPGSERSPGEGNGQSTPLFLPGKSHGQRNLVGYSLWHHRESDMTTTRASKESSRELCGAQLKTPTVGPLGGRACSPPPRAQGPQTAGPGCRQQRALGEPRSARTWRGATRPLAARCQGQHQGGGRTGRTKAAEGEAGTATPPKPQRCRAQR